ncbi:MAG: recombinase XerC [Candidatus Methanoperedenaceae archaeon]|nr:MAG: recombinase XerC [Candidatus Methanoperedenaceae archaeon]
MKIESSIETFLNTIVVERNLSERTLEAYRSDLKIFSQIFKQREVEEITTENLREFIELLEKNHHYKDTTIKRKIATLKVFFNFVEQEGIIADSPTRKIRQKYKIAKRLPKVLSERELKKLLKASYNEIKILQELEKKNNNLSRAYRDCAILEILFSTGMRIGELVKLNVNGINLQERTILIFGKGRKERIIYISSDEVLSAIKEYLIYRKKIQTGMPALFLNRDKERLSIYSIENIFKKYCKKAKIKNHYTPHCLRHTIATMLLYNGADIRAVQEILGHASVITTQIYTEVSQKHKKKVLTKFNPRNRMSMSY